MATPFWIDLPDAEAELWRLEFEERAGIMEFHGNLSRGDAETSAYEIVLAEYRAQAGVLRMSATAERLGARRATGERRSDAAGEGDYISSESDSAK